MADLTLPEIEEKLAIAEDYLAANPQSEKGWTRYWELIGLQVKHEMQKEIHYEIKSVTLELPCEWSRDENSPKHRIVTVLFHDKPKKSDEMTYRQLHELNESLRLIAESQ